MTQDHCWTDMSVVTEVSDRGYADIYLEDDSGNTLNIELESDAARELVTQLIDAGFEPKKEDEDEDDTETVAARSEQSGGRS